MKFSFLSWIFPLIFLTIITFAEDTPPTGFSSETPTLGIGYCPDVKWDDYKVCQAICPKGFKPLSPPDKSGTYTCADTEDFLGITRVWKCTYTNPYCLTNSTLTTKFLNPLGELSLTEYIIRTITFDPILWKYSIEGKLYGHLSFFVETFNQIFPLFVNIAYFIFIVVFLMSLVYLTVLKSVDFFREKPQSKIDLTDYFIKGFIVFTFFGLPITHNVEANKNGVQYVASATPLALEVVRYVLLETNSLLTKVADRINQLYAEKSFEVSKKTLTNLYNVLDLNQKDAQNDLQRIKQEFKTQCINLVETCNSIDTFLVENDDLRNIQFLENGKCIKDYTKAVYCRNLELKRNALIYFLKINEKNKEAVINVLSKIVGEGEKILKDLKKTSNETTQKAGWLSTGINIPVIYLAYTEKLASKVQETLSKTIIPQTPEEKKIKSDEGIARILSYLMIVAIPPFNQIFSMVKDIASYLGDKAEAIILAGLSLLGIEATGGLSLLLLLALPFLVKIVNIGIALVITLFIAFIVMNYAILIGIAGATVFKAINLFIEIFTYSLAMPFKLLYIFVSGGSVQAINDFVRNLTRFSLMMLFITISPLVGLMVMVIIKLALGEVLTSALYTYKLYKGGIVAFISYYLLLSVVFLFVNLGAFIFAIRFTYTFPDIVFKLLSPFTSHFVSEESQMLWQRFSGIISPKL